MFAAMSEPPKKSKRLNMVISPEEVERIEEWRRRQTKIPSLSEAIRQLVAIGLEADKALKPPSR